MKKFFVTVALAATIVLGLAACAGTGGGAGAVATPAPGAASGVSPLVALDNALARFPQYINNSGEHVPGTVFHLGIESTAPFQGLFGGAIFNTSAVDGHVATLIGGNTPLLSLNNDFTFGNDGVARHEFDAENNTFTMTLQEDVFWSDGTPLTMRDLYVTYHIMAHPDYIGLRFSTHERMILGIMDYNSGYADSISGLQLSDDLRSLTFSFENLTPAMRFNGIWTSPLPAHIFENIAVADMLSSPYVLDHPVGWGPFIIQNVVPGESIHLVRNVNYVWGAPYIEEMVVERVEPSFIPAAMESGRFDVVMSFPAVYFGDTAEPTNYTFVGAPNTNYFFIAFRLGTFDAETGQNVYDAHRTMANPYLRRAMLHAVDHTQLGEVLFDGLQFAAGSYMAPIHTSLMDLSLPGFPFDPDLANQILDEGGFTQRDANGWRTNLDGTPLEINWAVGTNAALDDILIPFHIQAWNAIGLNVVLWQGRTHDQNFLWDTLDFDTDNEEIHIYTRRWTAGFNPHPSGRWGHTRMNSSRYTSPTYDALLETLSAPEAMDPEVMRQAYFNLQAYLQEHAPYAPTRWEIVLQAVNNRVSWWEGRPGYPGAPNNPTADAGWHVIRLTAAQPYVR